MNDIETDPSAGPPAGDELPIFPATAPATFADPVATARLFRPVVAELALVVRVDPALLDAPTPCRGFTVAQLRRHVLGWLQFFAAALGDPSGGDPRPDPDGWELGPGEDPADLVRRAGAEIEAAVEAGVARQLVVMSQARMAGDAVLAMALGEYLVHGWDLATSTGRGWEPAGDAAEAALAFLRETVAPEHRGPDSGFFDAEVPARAGAAPLERLLCFTGRQPGWTAAAG